MDGRINPRKDPTLVPFGTHQGERWADAPESWLYYVARNPTFLGLRARKEIRARVHRRGGVMPAWADERPK